MKMRIIFSNVSFRVCRAQPRSSLAALPRAGVVTGAMLSRVTCHAPRSVTAAPLHFPVKIKLNKSQI